jgi:hypothetical protein
LPTSSPSTTPCRWTQRSPGPGRTGRGSRQSSSGGCWTWRRRGAASKPPLCRPEARRSSSWKTPAKTTYTGRRRLASATLDMGPSVGPPARAASRRRRRATEATPTTMTAATTRVSTSIWACRTRVFSLG